MGKWCGMKKIDYIKLGLQEFRQDIKGSLLAFLVQISVFCLILVLQVLSIDIVPSFDSYLKSKDYNSYKVNLGGFSKGDREELEKDGVEDIIFYDDVKNKGEAFFTASGVIYSIMDYEHLNNEWDKKGKVIYSEMLEELCNVMFVGKIILVTLTLATYILFLGTISNIYGMKVQLRNRYVQMLFSLGAREKKIRRIFYLQFRICNLVAIMVSLYSVKKMYIYINSILSDEFEGMVIQCDILFELAMVLLVINDIVMRFVFYNVWKREGKKYES